MATISMLPNFDRLLKNLNARLLVLTALFSLAPVLLAARLWLVQVRQADHFEAQISEQTFRRIRVSPVRGRIYTRDGALLVDNEPSHDLYLHVHEMRQRGRSSFRETLHHMRELYQSLAQTVGRPPDLTDQELLAGIRSPLVFELTFYRDLAETEVAALRQARLPEGFEFARQQGQVTLVCALGACKQPGVSGAKATAKFVAERIAEVGSVIERVPTVSESRIRRHMSVYSALPLPIFRGLDAAELAAIQERMPRFPGLQLSTNVRRLHPAESAACHLLGFVGRRDPATEEERNAFNYWLPEWHGREGLEKAFDEPLRGYGGERIVKVDSAGFYHDSVAVTPSVRGSDLQLSLNLRAQQTAQRLLQGKRGALVAMDCLSGELLALASAPDYDLSTIHQTFGSLNTDPLLPKRNRAMYADYAPGSILKPLVALCALKHGVIAPGTQLPCPGYYAYGENTKIRCAARSGHGPLTVTQALERSCNPFFIRAGLKLGVDVLGPMMAGAGLGKDPGLEVSVPWVEGRCPSRAAMRRVRGRNWNAFDTGLVSIGQGFVTMSPLQATVMTAAIANGGSVLRPRLVRELRNEDGPQRVWRRQLVGKLDADPRHFALIRSAMRQVVNGRAATAPSADSPVISIAGKTGTAEIGTRSNLRKNTWFTCFAPYEAPRLAVTVLIEDGESGGRTAAPIARAFLEESIALLAAD